jgi:hypothetical protein
MVRPPTPDHNGSEEEDPAMIMPEVEAHSHHHPTHGGRRHWLDWVVPICALVISFISLMLAMIHGQAMERMADANARLVKANSWPYLEYSTGNMDERRSQIELRIGNVGVGPARVKSFALFWNGQPVADHNQLLARCCGAQNGSTLHMLIDQVGGRVLPARETVSFLTFPHDAANESIWQKLDKERVNVTARVCYCSVFDECWIGDIGMKGSSAQRPVDQCPVPVVAYTH